MGAPAFDTSYLALPDILHKPKADVPAPKPALIALNDAMVATLGLDAEWLASPDGLAMLSGGAVPANAANIALAYAGHQFGHFNPQLGDGRAVLLGEIVGTDGLRRDIHLKGSGRTVFSRGGDGKAALGPVIREYVLCEAMNALGVPTTRALAAVTTGETVLRDRPMPGAVFARVASSHIRVGTFQYLYARGEHDALRALADHAIARHAPQCKAAANPYAALIEHVSRKQAELVAQWLSLGFIHGVMNTDNMAISGETIDYGPCAFMEAYDPQQVFSSIDHGGRYAYGNQPQIAQWNLVQFAQSLLPLLDADETTAIDQARAALDVFPATFDTAYKSRMLAKIGVTAVDAPGFALVQDLLRLFARHGVDFTLGFRRLSQAIDEADEDAFRQLLTEPAGADMWLIAWRQRLNAQSRSLTDTATAMDAVNPVYIPRNHRVEQAIAAAIDGDYAPFHALNGVLADPFTERDAAAGHEQPAQPDEAVLQTFCGT